MLPFTILDRAGQSVGMTTDMDIERLGAKLDGILRSHRRFADASLRDTCVYSITAAEWPAVRCNLEFMLGNQPGEE